MTAARRNANRDVLLKTKAILAIKATVPVILTVRTNFGAINATNNVGRVAVEMHVTAQRAFVLVNVMTHISDKCVTANVVKTLYLQRRDLATKLMDSVGKAVKMDGLEGNAMIIVARTVKGISVTETTDFASQGVLMGLKGQYVLKVEYVFYFFFSLSYL